MIPYKKLWSRAVQCYNDTFQWEVQWKLTAKKLLLINEYLFKNWLTSILNESLIVYLQMTGLISLRHLWAALTCCENKLLNANPNMKKQMKILAAWIKK